MALCQVRPGVRCPQEPGAPPRAGGPGRYDPVGRLAHRWPAVGGSERAALAGLVTALELVHVPARVERGRGDEHRLAVPGLVLAGGEVVPEVARVVAAGIRRAGLELEVEGIRAHAQ